MYQRFDIVLGDDCMALYRDGKLAVAATKLTFIDILESCGVGCDIWEGDLDEYDDPLKFPPTFEEIDIQMMERKHE